MPLLSMMLIKFGNQPRFKRTIYGCAIHLLQLMFMREIDVCEGCHKRLHEWLELIRDDRRLVLRMNGSRFCMLPSQ